MRKRAVYRFLGSSEVSEFITGSSISRDTPEFAKFGSMPSESPPVDASSVELLLSVSVASLFISTAKVVIDAPPVSVTLGGVAPSSDPVFPITSSPGWTVPLLVTFIEALPPVFSYTSNDPVTLRSPWSDTVTWPKVCANWGSPIVRLPTCSIDPAPLIVTAAPRLTFGPYTSEMPLLVTLAPSAMFRIACPCGPKVRLSLAASVKSTVPDTESVALAPTTPASVMSEVLSTPRAVAVFVRDRLAISFTVVEPTLLGLVIVSVLPLILSDTFTPVTVRPRMILLFWLMTMGPAYVPVPSKTAAFVALGI